MQAENSKTPQREIKTLDNGLRLVAVQIPYLHSAELALYIKTGGRNDPPGKQGLSHFLEHMLFKGTSDYPAASDIEAAFEAIGGSVNASTDEECTCFFSRVHPKHLPTAVAILSSMILRPLLNDLEIEKRIIAEEALDDLSEKGEEINPHNLASQLLWPAHPLGEPTIGRLETIASFTAADLRKHLADYYLPANAVLVAAGNFAAADFFTAAADCFAAWHGGLAPIAAPPEVSQTAPQTVFVADSDSQSHLQLSFRAFARSDARIMPLRLLRRILCGSGSSRLHLTLREQLGIVYSVDANIAAYEETGYFSIELSTGAENLATAVSEVLRELENLAITEVDPLELERVKNIYNYELEYSKDSCFEMQIRYGWGELMQVVREIEEDIAQSAALTPKDLKSLAKELFAPANMNLVVVGSWGEKEKALVLAEMGKYSSSRDLTALI